MQYILNFHFPIGANVTVQFQLETIGIIVYRRGERWARGGQERLTWGGVVAKVD